MTKRCMLLIFTLILSLWVVGCSAVPDASTGGPAAGQQAEQGTETNASKGTWPLTITDDSGVEVTIPKQPERIVSLLPSTTEIAFALGLGNRVVGVSDHDDYPEEAKTKEKIGGLEVNTEKVLSLKPDLVLGGTSISAKPVETLRGLGLTVVTVEPLTIDDVYESIRLIGQVTGTSDKAEEVISQMKREREQVHAALKDLKPEDKPKVWLELDEHLYTAGKGSILHQLIEEAGGVNVAGDVEGWPQFSAEKVIQANPDVILVNYSHVPDPIGQVKQRAGWDVIKAVQENRVHQLDEDKVSRPGPRLTQALVEIAKILHPNSF